jgi:F0F1-type ATP synthase membrane subunit b/b'
LINLLILIGLLIYGNKVSVQPNLEQREKEIRQTIENAQNDVVRASNYFYLAEQGFVQSIFWFDSWKSLSQKEKEKMVQKKFELVQTGLIESLTLTETLIQNFEKKSFLSLQRYLLFLTASRVLRKFLFLSEADQSKLIDTILFKLGGDKA